MPSSTTETSPTRSKDPTTTIPPCKAATRSDGADYTTPRRVATDAANTPGLDPSISDPMHAWSMDATKLSLKMAMHIPGTSLDTSVAEMNTDATTVQKACAAAGTHA